MDKLGKGWASRSIEHTGASVGAPQGAAPAAPGGAEAESNRLVAASGGFGTFIDQGAQFEGTLRLLGPFRIDSEFRGAIESEDKVIVGESGGIESDIRAREIVISGAVVGNVYASRLLIIRNTGRLHGNIEAPCVEIERGAVFNGCTAMVRPEVAARAAKPAAARDAQPAASATPPATTSS